MSIDTDALLNSVDIVAVAGKYTRLKPAGREHVGLCPFHNDSSPSFCVVPHKRFAVCMSCGWNGDAIKLVMDGDRVDFREACERLGAGDFKPDPQKTDVPKPVERITRPPPPGTPPPDMTTRTLGAPVRTWEYRDAAGDLLFLVARYEFAEEGATKKLTPQWTWGSRDGGKSYEWSMGHYSSPRPLYGLTRLAQRQTAPVLIVEGEKSADAAQQLAPMYVVITWPGGSHAVSKADWTPLKGRRILIWPDRDLQRYKDGHERAGEVKPIDEQPGTAAANEIAAILRDLGVEEIKIIDVGISS